MKILTIDGNNLVHRVYYVANNMPHKSEFLHVYMFLNSVKSYVEMYRPDKVYCVWDEKLVYKPNKRLELLPEQKGTRDKEKGTEVHTENNIIKELFQYSEKDLIEASELANQKKEWKKKTDQIKLLDIFCRGSSVKENVDINEKTMIFFLIKGAVFKWSELNPKKIEFQFKT